MSCSQRSQHILCDPGCIKFNPSECPSGQPTHVLCNLRENKLSICTCSGKTPYSCRPMCKAEKSDKLECQTLKPTVFDNCSILEESYSPDLLFFNNLEHFISTFCGESVKC